MVQTITAYLFKKKKNLLYKFVVSSAIDFQAKIKHYWELSCHFISVKQSCTRPYYYSTTPQSVWRQLDVKYIK